MSDTAASLAREQLAALLAEAGRGRTAALEALYRKTGPKLFGIILRVTQGDRAAAEDILQDVYVKVWRKSAYFNASRASPITWLATIARNTAIDWRRSRNVRPDECATGNESPDDVEESVDAVALQEDRATRHHILDCIAQLEPRQARAVREAFYDGLSHSELAARMDVPLGTLKSWIRRAMISLRKCIDDQQ